MSPEGYVGREYNTGAVRYNYSILQPITRYIYRVYTLEPHALLREGRSTKVIPSFDNLGWDFRARAMGTYSVSYATTIAYQPYKAL